MGVKSMECFNDRVVNGIEGAKSLVRKFNRLDRKMFRSCHLTFYKYLDTFCECQESEIQECKNNLSKAIDDHYFKKWHSDQESHKMMLLSLEDQKNLYRDSDQRKNCIAMFEET